MHELLALVRRQLLEVLPVDALLQLGRSVLGELLHMAGRLILVNLTVVAGVNGLGILLIHLLVVLVKGEHGLAPFVRPQVQRTTSGYPESNW